LIRPTGFKGGYLTELWQPVARLDSDSGRSHIGIGTQSVLWCDPRVLAAHSESAGNAMMLSVTDHALQLLVGESFTNPVELLDRIFPDVYAFATRVTGLPNLRRTFALNALVPVDNAAWLLYAAENGIRSFDEMIPEEYRAGLSTRNRAIASLPSVTYGLPIADVVSAARDGYFVIKLKLGSPGTQAEMLEKDIARLTEGASLPDRHQHRTHTRRQAPLRSRSQPALRAQGDAASAARCGEADRARSIRSRSSRSHFRMRTTNPCARSRFASSPTRA
jgi:hypothetical protein